jgi:hypothetical protein
MGVGVVDAAPGSLTGVRLVVADIDAARAELAGRGLEVSEVTRGPAPVSDSTIQRLTEYPSRTGDLLGVLLALHALPFFAFFSAFFEAFFSAFFEAFSADLTLLSCLDFLAFAGFSDDFP